MSGPPQTAALGKPVDVRAIERELADLLGPEPGEQPVIRACMSNLIVYCDAREAQAVPGEIAAIVQRHPARVLLLVAEAPREGRGLEAWVSAHCSVASGGKQICSEHVTVSAPRDATRRLPSTARALLIGDLPTTFWWAAEEPPPPGRSVFDELSEMARHVIFDSAGWTNPVGGLVSTAEWVRRSGAIVSDLAWRRLKAWRRAVSQTLDPAVVPEALDGTREVVVEHGPHALSQAWLLVGWLVRSLGWEPVGGRVEPGLELHFDFRSERGPLRVTVRRLPQGEAELRSVRLEWRARGRPGSASFTRLGPGRIGIETAGSTEPHRVLAAPTGARADLVARQLPKLFGDRVLREALGVSRAMAEAVLA